MSKTKKENEEKLVRCVCGEVFDRIKKVKCPECGTVMVAREEKVPTRSEESHPVARAVAAPVKTPMPAWKIGAGAIGFLLILMFLKGEGSVKPIVYENTPEKEYTPQQPERTSPETSDTPAIPVLPPPSQNESLPTIVPSKADKKNPSPDSPWQSEQQNQVDGALVGTWVNFINSGSRGQQRWVLRILANGQYQMAGSGAGLNKQHSGEFTAKNRNWSMISSDRSFQDSGTLQWLSPESFQLVSQKGIMTWSREGSRSRQNAQRTPVSPKRASDNQVWEQVQQEAARQAQGAFEDVLRRFGISGNRVRR